MAVLVWVMVGIAFWHFTVLVPDRFWGGIIGAFLAALGGALAAGYMLPEPGIPTGNPPGVAHVLWAAPGAVAALIASYFYGARQEAKSPC
jgi:tetrahydromethanopterin S-methyltransferase subunit D